MRFLADAGVSPKTVEFLKQLGHDAVHVRTLGLQRAADPELVDRAPADSSVILTFDLDFGDILALGVLDKPSVIICRLADERADSVNCRLSTILHERHAELESGALILAEDTRYRVRKLAVGTDVVVGFPPDDACVLPFEEYARRDEKELYTLGREKD